MQWHIPYQIAPASKPVSYGDGIMLLGSCFSENIGLWLKRLKFNAMVNPAGIVFDPLSIAHHFDDFCYERKYSNDDLIFNDELLHSYHHHGSFSHKLAKNATQKIEQQTRLAAQHLKETSLLVLTPGTAYVYKHKPSGRFVANCHKIPANQFEKKLLEIGEIEFAFERILSTFFDRNPHGQVVFTVSPVRHIRDGLVENNRSKARLLEAVHHVAGRYEQAHYFPAYELLIDVLRDYRFYAEDGVHPNDQAIKYIFEAFSSTWISKASNIMSRKVEAFVQGMEHRPLHPQSDAHKKFLEGLQQNLSMLQKLLPDADWTKEQAYFEQE